MARKELTLGYTELCISAPQLLQQALPPSTDGGLLCDQLLLHCLYLHWHCDCITANELPGISSIINQSVVSTHPVSTRYQLE